jgi:hypothetical protein
VSTFDQCGSQPSKGHEIGVSLGDCPISNYLFVRAQAVLVRTRLQSGKTLKKLIANVVPVRKKGFIVGGVRTPKTGGKKAKKQKSKKAKNGREKSKENSIDFGHAAHYSFPKNSLNYWQNGD